ncbi:MAG: hypothetical protein HXY20_08025 [Acidobacteria bacterium]|nr:hypothetical protein [Acidobacteriota bacterium]
MKIKVLLCNCKGLCPSFKDTNMNTLPFQLESELEVQYVMLHPMTCGQGGNQALIDMLRSAGDGTYVISAACAPKAQEKLFAKILRTTGFPAERFIMLDIRGTDNEGILNRLRQTIEGLLSRQQAPVTAPVS